MSRKRLGVYCVEHWSSNLTRRDSVKPLLEFMRDNGRVNLIHERVQSKGELKVILAAWGQKQYADYPFGYLGFHGRPGTLHIGRARTTLEELTEVLSGRCKGKFLYFASCATLDLKKTEIADFRHHLNARCVLGYTESVDWWESSAFDLLLLDAFSRYQHLDAIENYLRTNHLGLLRRLGFRMHYRS